MQEIPTVMAVVAVAMIAPNGEVLMHRRRLGAVHGGLWEFPGGKVEPGETRELALVREIEEELDVVLEAGDLTWLAEARDDQAAIVIDLYIARRWKREARCIEGEAIGWFACEELLSLAMPPLDVPLAAALRAALETGK